jgi:hypothetical protein
MSLLKSMGAGIRSARPPYISINNRQFHAVNGNDRRPIMGFDQRTGRTFCDFVVVGAADVITKMLYQEDYNPGGEPKPPLCMSMNGVGPSARQSPFPQAPRCDQCEWNVWAQGAPPVCKDYKTLVVVAPMFDWETELQFNIPPASFKNFSALLASLGQIRMEGGRPIEAHEIIIRMYFGGEQGILEFVPAENAFLAQACGQQTVDYLATKIGTEKVRALSGHTDTPIDPARWLPPSGSQAALPAPAGQPVVNVNLTTVAPAAAYQPPVAPQGAYASTGGGYAGPQNYAPPAVGQGAVAPYTPPPAPMAPPAPPANTYVAPPVQNGAAYGGGQPGVTYHQPAPLEGGYMNQGTPQQNYAATVGYAGSNAQPQQNYAPPAQPQQNYAPPAEQQYQPNAQPQQNYAPPAQPQQAPVGQGAVAAAGPELVEGRPQRKPRATKAEMAARRAAEQGPAAPQQGGYAQAPGGAPAAPQQGYSQQGQVLQPQQNYAPQPQQGGYAQAPGGAPAAPQQAAPSTDMHSYGMNANPEQAGAALMTQLDAALHTPTR